MRIASKTTRIYLRVIAEHRERIKKFRETGNLKHIFKNELDKACFACDAAYSDSKDVARRTISIKILKERPYEIAINPKCDGYQREVVSMVDKKTGAGANVMKFHKPVI